MAQIKLTTGAAAATPDAGQLAIYAKSTDKKLYYKDDTGTESGPVSTGTGPFSSVLYVDVLGDDLTGTRGDINRPFATLDAAVQAATDGDEIVMGPGIFTVASAITWGTLTSLRITGAGQNDTVVTTAIVTALIDVPSTFTSLFIRNMTLQHINLAEAIRADGSAVGSPYLQSGLVLENLALVSNGTDALYLKDAGILLLNNVLVAAGNAVFDTTSFYRCSDLQVANDVFVAWDDDDANQPIGGRQVFAPAGFRCTNLTLKTQASVILDGSCIVGGTVTGDGLSEAVTTLVPSIIVHCRCGSVNFTGLAGALPDTTGPVIPLDFTNAVIGTTFSIEVAGAPPATAQDVRAHNLMVPGVGTVTIGPGINFHDRCANAASGIYSIDPAATFTPGIFVDEVDLAVVAPLPAVVNFGFTASIAPTSAVATSQAVATGVVAVPATTASSYTIDAAVAAGKVQLIFSWKDAF